MSGCQTREENAVELARQEELHQRQIGGWQILLDGQICERDGDGNPFVYETLLEAEEALTRELEDQEERFGEGFVDGCNYTVEQVK